MVGSEHSAGVVWYYSPLNQRYPIAEGSFTTDGEIFDMDGDGDGDLDITSIAWDTFQYLHLWKNYSK